MRRIPIPYRRSAVPACLLAAALLPAAALAAAETSMPFLLVLGIAQDAGIPQAGSHTHPAWQDVSLERHATCLGLVDPRSGRRWLFEATPDLRRQLYELDRVAPEAAARDSTDTAHTTTTGPVLDGVFITHAHIGHYAGLMFLGHESMGARGVPVHVMPRMQEYLRRNGPWDQLVRYGNIVLRPLQPDRAVPLADDLRVTPLPVPHRQEYSEVVAFRIDGPRRRVLFLPDIDAWGDLDSLGVAIEDWIASVDVAFLDGTFFADGEIPGRDMSGFPHPFITTSLQRFVSLPPAEKAKIRFIHLNHSNPAARPASAARARIEAAGFHVAGEGERIDL